MSLTWCSIDSFHGNGSNSATGQSRACPVCQSLGNRILLTLKDFQFFSDSVCLPKRMTLHQVQCRLCFAIYLNPGYSSYGFRVLFAEAGCSYGATSVRSQEQRDWLATRELLKPGLNLLDVGCYDGRFLSELPDHIHKVGFDIDAPAIERGRDLFSDKNIQFIHGDFENFCPQEAPDVITMYHVLEHLPDPVAALKNLRQFSHGNTKLVLEIPILENGKTNDINGFFSVQHMTHFSRNSFANAMKLSGWAIVDEMEAADYNGYRVLATPCVAEENIVADPSDLNRSLDYLSWWYSVVRSVSEKLSVVPATDRLVIWGGGMHLEFLYQVTQLLEMSPDRDCVIVDSDKLKQGRSWRGISIYDPSCLSQLDWSQTTLVVSSYGGQEAIAQSALMIGVPEEKIVKFYDSVHVY